MEIPGKFCSATKRDSPVAILALMASAIAGGMPASATPEHVLVTVIAAIVLTSILTGMFFWGLGKWKLGGLIRFIPYPVVGGFLAGTGWLLVKGALGMMADIPISYSTFFALFQFNILLKWLPGVLFGVLLLIILRRYSHFLIMPDHAFTNPEFRNGCRRIGILPETECFSIGSGSGARNNLPAFIK